MEIDVEMLYFITDAAGHSGSVTTRKLINSGKQVRALV